MSLRQNGNFYEKWMISRIKYKCLITLESLLEGNRDFKILKKMIKALPVQILKKNITWIYEKYRRIYGEKYTDEAFNNFDLNEVPE